MLAELIHQKNCKKKSIITDYHTGEIACSNCGSVLSEQVVEAGPETNTETGNGQKEQKQSRAKNFFKNDRHGIIHNHRIKGQRCIREKSIK